MHKVILHSIFILFSLQFFAQADSLKYDKSTISIKKFETENLDSFRGDKDFQYELKKPNENFFTIALRWLGNQFLKVLQWLFGERRAGGIFGVILTILPYFIGFIMLILILKVFINVQTDSIIAGTNKNSKIQLSEDEELIKKSDINGLISKALHDKDFRLAVRYSYLKALQQLEINKYITWEQQKTNHDYENEILMPAIQEHFRNITYLYDFVWYGNFDIDEKGYKLASQLFNKLESAL